MTPVEQANFDQERELVKYWRDKHYANLQVIFNLQQRVKELEGKHSKPRSLAIGCAETNMGDIPPGVNTKPLI